ncbi:hypothetical protein D9M68_690280 [compost metagenome]
MARHVAAGRQGYRHRRYQHGQQRDQRQEALRAIQGAAYLWAAGFQRGHFLAALQVLLEPGRVAGHGVGLAGDQQGVADTAAWRDQAGGGQIAGPQQHPRRHVDELHAAVGFIGDHPVDAQARVAHVQTVANLQVQQGQQLRVHPYGALGRDVARGGIGRERRVRHPQGAAQRIARLDGLQRGQLRAVARAHHGRELPGAGHGQAALPGLIHEGWRHGLVGVQHQIGAQHLPRIALQRPADPVGQEAHAGHRGHRHDQRQHQQPQLAGTGVAHHHPGT